MELGNVLSKFSQKEKKQEKFFAIEIGIDTVTAAIWEVQEKKTKVVSVGSTEDWESSDTNESLLNAIDTSITKTLEGIKSEPNRVMFGLQEGWVEGDSIIKQYTSLLKEVCEKFEFEPVGFVVTTEAIIQLLKKEEGTPPTTILIRVNEAELQVSVVNLGKIIGYEIVARSEDIGADVEEGLARFKVDEYLPSKMVIFNGSQDLEKLKQDLLSYSWLEKLPFLHFPKVQILDRQVAIKAVALAGGAEAANDMGFEIIVEEDKSKAGEKEKEEEPQQKIQEESTTVEELEKQPSEVEKEPSEPTPEKSREAISEKKEEKVDDNVVVADASEIGFNALSESETKAKENKERE